MLDEFYATITFFSESGWETTVRTRALKAPAAMYGFLAFFVGLKRVDVCLVLAIFKIKLIYQNKRNELVQLMVISSPI